MAYQKRLFQVKEKESELLTNIKRYLTLNQCYCIRFNSGVFKLDKMYYRSYILPNNKSSGIPDLMFFRRGKVYFIEVKVGNNELRESQQEFIERIREYGIKTLVAYSIDDVIEFLENIKKE